MRLGARLDMRLLAPLAGIALITDASAQTFDVKTPDVKRGSLELGLDNTLHTGVPHDPGAAVNRSVHEQSLDYGLLSWWKVSGVLKLEKPEEDAFRANAVALENLIVLRPMAESKPRDVALGWFTSIDASINRDTTNAVLFGPVATVKADKLTVGLNPFFEQTFGRNSVDGIALNYAWQVKYDVREGLAVGVEGYGVVDNLGDPPPWQDQTHRVGPVVFTELKLAEGLVLTPDIGLLFGLTRATPDVALKFNVGVPLR
jgi:hypothetical protein